MKSLILLCLLGLTPIFATQAAQHAATISAAKTHYRNVPGPSEKSLGGDGLRIWNGGKAEAGQFPFYVGVYIDMSGFCGGSLIHEKWVLTAAHCVDGGSVWTMFMGVLSMIEPKQQGREVHVSRGGFHHADYDESRIINDVGLIQLKNRVEATNMIGVVKLTPAGASYVNTKPTVAGFGKINDDLELISDVLRFSSMPVVSNDVCYSVYGDTHPSWICLTTATDQTSSCSGDSGGPLVVYDANNKPIQIGATSFGATAGCTLGYPVGFVNLAMFIDWIAEHTGLPADTFVAP